MGATRDGLCLLTELFFLMRQNTLLRMRAHMIRSFCSCRCMCRCRSTTGSRMYLESGERGGVSATSRAGAPGPRPRGMGPRPRGNRDTPNAVDPESRQFPPPAHEAHIRQALALFLKPFCSSSRGLHGSLFLLFPDFPLRQTSSFTDSLPWWIGLSLFFPLFFLLSLSKGLSHHFWLN